MRSLLEQIGATMQGVAREADSSGSAQAESSQRAVTAAQAARQAVAESIATARIATEAARSQTEGQKALTEAERAHTEHLRGVTELGRQVTEIRKQQTEAERANTEASRQATEGQRAATEAQRTALEAQRQATEVARQNTEARKQQTEAQRSVTEQERQFSETARQATEARRQSTEQAKQGTEAARQTTEANRAVTESQRAVTEQTRQQTEAAKTQAAAAQAAATQQVAAARAATEASRQQTEAARAAAIQQQAALAAHRTAISANQNVLTGFTTGVAQGMGVTVPLSIAAATAATVRFGVESAKGFGEFERGLREAVTITGETGALADKTFGTMRASIEQLSTSLGVNAVDATKAFYEILSSGVNDPAKAMEVLTVAAKSAIGGVTDLKTASDAITSALNAYGLQASEATRVSDVLFSAVRDGKVRWDELGRSLGFVFPTAHLVGVSMEEVAGAIAAMTNQGVVSQTALIQLNQLLNSVLKPSKDAKDAAKELGIEWSVAALSSKGLVQFLTEVDEKTRDNAEVFTRLVPEIRGARAAYQLTGETLQKFAEYSENARHSTGNLNNAFGEVNKSGARAFEAFDAQVAQLNRNVGEVTLPYLRDAALFVGQLGAELGAWPKDTPSAQQTENFKEIANAARDAAAAVKLVVGALDLLEKPRQLSLAVDPLNNILKLYGAYNALSEVYRRKTEDGTVAAREASVALRGYAEELARLDTLLATGGLTKGEYTAAVAALDEKYAALRATVTDYVQSQGILEQAQSKVRKEFDTTGMTVDQLATKLQLLQQEYARYRQVEQEGGTPRFRSIDELEKEAKGQLESGRAKRDAAGATKELTEAERRYQEQLGNIQKNLDAGLITEKEAKEFRERAAADYEAASKRKANATSEENEFIAENLRLATAGALEWGKFADQLLGVKNKYDDLTRSDFEAKLKAIGDALAISKITAADADRQVAALTTAYNQQLDESARKAAAALKTQQEESKRAQEAIAKQNKTASESVEALSLKLATATREGLQAVTKIADAHDAAYNAAIQGAAEKQRDIRQKREMEEADTRAKGLKAELEVQHKLEELEQGRDDAAKERGLRLQRQEQDRQTEALEREKEFGRQRAEVERDTQQKIADLKKRFGEGGQGPSDEHNEADLRREAAMRDARHRFDDQVADAHTRNSERTHDADLKRDEQLSAAQARLDESRAQAEARLRDARADADARRNEATAQDRERLEQEVATARERHAERVADAEKKHNEAIAEARAKLDDALAAARERRDQTLADAEQRRADAAGEAAARRADAAAAAAQKTLDLLAKHTDKQDEEEKAKRLADVAAAYERKLIDETARYQQEARAAQTTAAVDDARQRHEQALRDLAAERDAAATGAETGGTGAARDAVAARAAEERARHEQALADELARHEAERAAAATDAQKAAERERYAAAQRALDDEHALRLRKIADESGLLTDAQKAESDAAQAAIDREHKQRLSDLQDEEDARIAAANKALDEADALAEKQHKDAADRADRDHKDALDRAAEEQDDALAKAQERYDDAEKKARDLHDRALADAQERHDDALAKAQDQYDDAKDKATRAHKDALDKADREHKDALDKAADRFKDTKAKQDEAHAQALINIFAEYTDQKAKLDQYQIDHLKAIDDAETKQKDATKRAYDLQDQREAEDNARRIANAGERLRTELANVKTRYDQEVYEINRRAIADIDESNRALAKKQEAIDEQRAKDYEKFDQDLKDRMSDIRDKWEEAMGDLDKLIPGDVRRIIQGGQALIGGVVAQISGAIQRNGRGAGMPPLRQPDEPEDAAERGRPGGMEEGFTSVLAELRKQATVVDTRIATEAKKQLDAGRLGGDKFAVTGVPSNSGRPGAPTESGEQAVAWALSRVGQQAYIGACEKFVENAYGADLVFGSAWKAAQETMTRAGGSLADAPRGAPVYFRPHSSNDNYGHVGIALGDGRFVSALYSGIAIQGPSQYWNNLYAGYGAPTYAARRAFGGDVDPGRPYLVGDRGDGAPEVFVPRTPGTIYPSAAPFAIDYAKLAEAVSEALSRAMDRQQGRAAAGPPARSVTINAHGADPASVTREISRWMRRQEVLDRALLPNVA